MAAKRGARADKGFMVGPGGSLVPKELALASSNWEALDTFGLKKGRYESHLFNRTHRADLSFPEPDGNLSANNPWYAQRIKGAEQDRKVRKDRAKAERKEASKARALDKVNLAKLVVMAWYASKGLIPLPDVLRVNSERPYQSAVWIKLRDIRSIDPEGFANVIAEVEANETETERRVSAKIQALQTKGIKPPTNHHKHGDVRVVRRGKHPNAKDVMGGMLANCLHGLRRLCK